MATSWLVMNYNLEVYLWHADKLEDGQDFLVAGVKDQLQPKEEEPVKEDTNGTSSAKAIDVDDDIVEVSNGSGDKKRPLEESNGNGAAKKARIEGDDEGGGALPVPVDEGAEVAKMLY